MKTNSTTPRQKDAGYALLIVLVIVCASAMIMAGTINRTYTVSKLNSRNNQYSTTLNAAEAAVEKVYARMASDFSTPGLALAAVTNNAATGIYQTLVPNTSESSYWSNFIFSDAQGHDNKVYVGFLNNYTGNLPSQFNSGGTNLATANAPVYRIVANARMTTGLYSMTNAVQEDILLALVPISTMAIFSTTNMEFVGCAPLTVNGRVHANANIFTGTISSSSLTFNSQVTADGVIQNLALGGYALGSLTGAITYNGGNLTNTPPVVLSMNMTNTHSIIDMPPAGESPSSAQGAQRLYNEAQVVLLVSNTAVKMIIQSGLLPGADSSPVVLTSTNTVAALSTNFPFLVTTNSFTDQRQGKTMQTSQIDVGLYAKWIATNASILSKFPSGSGTYPTILYVADNRTITASQLDAVRLTNGIAPPSNGGLGFTVATPNSLYVWGNYNDSSNGVAINLNTTNTTYTVPCGLIADAFTVLSPSWQDSQSNASFGTGVRVASNTTINAALIAGLVYSTGTTSSTYSGGIFNTPRLLEDWGNGGATTLTLNTSLLSLFSSTQASGQWQFPGAYYYAPTRHISYDLNFFNPAKQPPGMPCALMPVRFNYATPPPNTITYNVKL